MEPTNFEKNMHKRCLDAMTNGIQGHLQERPAMENKFNVVENSRFGWVPFGAIFHWCQQQHMLETKEQGVFTEARFWNMILHTKNVSTGRCSYNVKYWPILRMAMIKATTENEEEAENDTRRAQRKLKDEDRVNAD
eukprot:4693358-Heterocapsa_arctica.AAC.1